MAGYAWEKWELDLLYSHSISGGKLITAQWAKDNLPDRTLRTIKQKKMQLVAAGSVESFLAERKDGGIMSRPKQPASASRSIPELMRDMAQAFNRKQARADDKNDLAVHLPDSLPYILALFGDPHVGDNGCDIEYLAYCMAWASKTPRVHALNLGDLSNNWVGGLQRLYAHQSTTNDEEIALVEWLLDSCPWMLVILGNHDKWGPVASLLCQSRKIPYVSHGGILKVWSSDCELPVIVDVRHTHRGNSQYNPSFAQAKMSYRGSPADIIAGGHTHNGAVTVLRNGVTGKVSTCIRVGTFKKHDEYADAQGFLSEDLGPLCLCVIDPREDDVDRVTVFHSPDKAERYLKSLLTEAGEVAA